MPATIRSLSQPRLLMIGSLAAAMLVAGGCTTKKYVRQQTAPLMEHVNQLDAETAKNTNAIRDTDQRTQKGLADVNASTDKALASAQQAQEQANQVNSKLANTSNQIEALDKTVANLEDYKQTSEASVHFGFDKATLTTEAKSELDKVVAQLQQDSHGIL
ncbi:MAG TPA: OmpA family protein, partial [Terriglobales bacterium]|nr:OmpA family protein [Terriglobales bacterium]